VRSGKVPIIACRDFMQHTISENVYAGNAMNLRLFYQYGVLLPVSPHGFVSQGIGPTVSYLIGAQGRNRTTDTAIFSRWLYFRQHVDIY